MYTWSVCLWWLLFYALALERGNISLLWHAPDVSMCATAHVHESDCT